jgi:hypothetical protein
VRACQGEGGPKYPRGVAREPAVLTTAGTGMSAAVSRVEIESLMLQFQTVADGVGEAARISKASFLRCLGPLARSSSLIASRVFEVVCGQLLLSPPPHPSPAWETGQKETSATRGDVVGRAGLCPRAR